MIRLLHAYTVAYSALTLSRGLFEFLADHGYENDVVVSDHYGALEQLRDQPGVRRVHPITMTRQLTPLKDVRALKQARQIVSEGAYDLIHTNSPKASLVTTIAGRSLRGSRPVILYMVRGLPLESRTGAQFAAALAAERLTVGLADSVVYVSRSLQKAAASYRACSPRGVVLGSGSSNGVDTTFFAPVERSGQLQARASFGMEEDQLVVGFVGRLTPDKGISRLRRFWPLVQERRPDARLLLVGAVDEDFPVSARDLQWIEDEPSVTLTGHVEDVRVAFAAMDIVVLPTYREGLPNVLLEAAASALPVIATPTTGCIDVVIDNVTGRLIPGDDPSAWASAILQMDSSCRAAYGSEARRFVIDNFDRVRVWRQLESHYTELLDRARSGG